MSPTVTVFIPVYNGSAHLLEAIESIRAQTLEDWECILIDDASTDASWDILRGIDDPRFRVLRNPVNTHVATTSNIAMRQARGRYFARLDQDDLAMPDRLKHQVEFLDSHPDVAVCGGWVEHFGQRQGISKLSPDDGTIKAMLLPAMGFIANPASMARMDFIRDRHIVSDPRYPLSCDYGMWVDCMFQGARFANLQEVVTRYRLHAGQGSKHKDEIRRGVRPMRLQILHAWFPGLSGAQVNAMEPILHAYGPPSLSGAQVKAGLEACQAALAEPGASVHGEDRALVRAYITQQYQGWKGALETPAAKGRQAPPAP
jgi:glycosyltransferase involved in cell wall biosynthesis